MRTPSRGLAPVFFLCSLWLSVSVLLWGSHEMKFFCLHGRPSRRDFLCTLGLAGAGIAASRLTFAADADDSLPVTGGTVAGLESFDEMMTAFLKDNKIPGGALAVTRQGKLVYARGFGYADLEKKEPVEPAALFRIASVSKPLTAVAVLQLAEKGKIKLDDNALDHLKLEPHLEPDAKVDLRWARITIRQLLRHTGGWDRTKSYDPIGIPWKIAAALKIKPPVTPEHIVRYMMVQPLDFEPGERYAYSNLGYLILGRVIEAVSGERYETYVRTHVLEPLGVKDAKLGRALLENRAKGEVKYYDFGKRTARALYGPKIGELVPAQYGGDNFESFEAHGGWIASAVDLARFVVVFDDPKHCPILKPETFATIWERPEGRAGQTADGKPRASYYGCGWSVRPTDDKENPTLWHTGLIGGTGALLVRRHDGLNWAVLFNTDRTAADKVVATVIDPLVHLAANKVKDWPAGDLFEKYFPKK